MSLVIENDQNSHLKKTLFYGFILVYTITLLYLSNVLNIWLDEAYTLDTTSYNLSKVISQSYSFESQPPVYFILLSLWRKISMDVFFARLFSIISIGLAAYFFYRLIRLISGVEASRWLLVLFLLNPFIVWAGLEVRLYAFLLFLSTALIYYFFNYYINGKNKYLFLFLATCLIGLYTQYFFAFLIAALVFASLILRGWKFCFKTGLYLLPVVLLFLPNLLFMGDQLGMVQSQKEEFTAVQRVSIVLHSPQNVLLAMAALPLQRIARLAILFIFLAFTGYAYYKVYTKHKAKPSAYFGMINFNMAAAIALIAILAVFIAVTGIDHQDRYLTIAMPFFILMYTLFSVHNFLQSRLVYMVLSLYFIAILTYTYYKPYKQYDYKAVAAYIEKKARKNEPILFYHSVVSLPFNYYYKGNNPVVPLPHQVFFDTSYMNNVKDTFELKQSLQQINTTSGSYLLVSDLTEPKYKNDSNRKMVNDYLNSHYTISLDTLYFGNSKNSPLRIRRLERN
jgi:4-amino-4-deoxy-L-arabinose transferase-like glycosyltransferase